MRKFDINIDELIIGKVVSLEEYETSFKNMRSSFAYMKNFIGGRYLKYDNTKDAVIANLIGKNYSDKYADGALLIFYQTHKDQSASVCFIDTASLGQNNSILKLERLDIEKYASDANKIEDMLLFFRTSPPREVRYFVSGESKNISKIIERSGEEMSEKFLKEFFPKPFLCAATKSKNILKLTGVILLPLILATAIGHSFMSGSSQRLDAEVARLSQERALLQTEIEQARLNPLLLNEKNYGNVNHKRIAI